MKYDKLGRIVSAVALAATLTFGNPGNSDLNTAYANGPSPTPVPAQSTGASSRTDLTRDYLRNRLHDYFIKKPAESPDESPFSDDLILVDCKDMTYFKGKKAKPTDKDFQFVRDMTKRYGLQNFIAYSPSTGDWVYLDWLVDGREFNSRMEGHYRVIASTITREELDGAIDAIAVDGLYKPCKRGHPHTTPSPTPQPRPSPSPEAKPSPQPTPSPKPPEKTGLDILMEYLIELQRSGSINGLVRDNPKHLNGCYTGDSDFFAYTTRNGSRVGELMVEIDSGSDRASQKLQISGGRVFLTNGSPNSQENEDYNFRLMESLGADLNYPVGYARITETDLQKDGGKSKIDSAIERSLSPTKRYHSQNFQNNRHQHTTVIIQRPVPVFVPGPPVHYPWIRRRHIRF